MLALLAPEVLQCNMEGAFFFGAKLFIDPIPLTRLLALLASCLEGGIFRVNFIHSG